MVSRLERVRHGALNKLASGSRAWLGVGLSLFLTFSLAACTPDAPEGDATPDRNRSSSPDGGLSDPDSIASLPYLNTVPDRDSGKSGVVLNLEGRTSPGVNLYTPRTIPEARLIDMKGTLIHRWASEAAQPAPGEAAIMDFLLGWHHVEPLGDGRLLAVVENTALLALDRDSNLIWMAELGVHHDVAPSPSGTLYILEARIRPHLAGSSSYPLLDDLIVELSADGDVLSTLSIMDLLLEDKRTSAVFQKYLQARMDAYTPERIRGYEAGLRRIHADLGEENVEAHVKLFHDVLAGNDSEKSSLRISALRNSPSDILHANSVEYLGSHPAGFWKEGDLLISIRNADMLAIVDMNSRRLRWVWGPGTLDQQHQPGATSRGTVLVFDNGPRAGRSRLLEIDPASDAMIWSFEGTPPSQFFSPIRGGCQELPNGNILVTESERGRVFEVTRQKEKVWEFYSTQVHRNGRRRAPIYRMARMERDWVIPTMPAD